MSTVITQKRTAKSVSEVPKKEFRNYSETLKRAARESGEAFKTIARAQLKNATSQEEMKSILYHAANDTFEQYANATGKISCDFFEACIKDAKQTEIAPIPKYIKKRLYEDIEDLLAGGAAVDARVLYAIADRVITESYHHGNRTTKHNAIRNGLRYARVPSGKACAFCLMLASRGFVYLSKISAGKDKGHYHNHCHCAVVAGNLKMKVGGYDPDGLNERMNKLAASLGIGDWTSAAADKELTKVLNRELAERDRRWVLNGKVPVYTQEPKARPLQKEKDIADKLSSQGIKCEFRATRSKEGKRTSDVFVLTGEEKKPYAYEFKTPTGAGKQTIYHQFESAAGQAKRIVLDTSKLPENWGAEKVKSEVSKKINWHYKTKDKKDWQFDEVRIINSKGEMKIIKRLNPSE